MLFALGQPAALLGLLLGFFVGVVVVGIVQARMMGDRQGLRARGGARGLLVRFVDPFGAIAAALGGVGWGVPVEPGRFRRGPARARLIRTLLAAPVVHLVLAALGVAGFAALGHLAVLGGIDTRAVLHGLYRGPLLDLTLLGFSVANLTMALLHVVPLPPMAAGRILLLLAPQTPAWQRATYHLEDNNWGVGILLALSLPLLSSSGSVSSSLTSALARPLLRFAAGLANG